MQTFLLIKEQRKEIVNLLGEQHDSGSWDKPECLWEAEPVKKQENFYIRMVLEFLKVSSKNVNLINVQNCIFLETEAKRISKFHF